MLFFRQQIAPIAGYGGARAVRNRKPFTPGRPDPVAAENQPALPRERGSRLGCARSIRECRIQWTLPVWCGLSRLKAGIATSKFCPEDGTTM